MDALEITEATLAQAIAGELIAEVHPHLRRARILYLFTNKKRKRCDRVVLGSASKMTGMQKFLSSGMLAVEDGFDFIILFGKNEWETLTAAQRRALVDHELCHCSVKDKDADDEDLEWMLKGHDIEEFKAVIERHGYWKDDVQEFAETVQQLPLSFGRGPERAVRDLAATVANSPGIESVTFSTVINGEEKSVTLEGNTQSKAAKRIANEVRAIADRTKKKKRN